MHPRIFATIAALVFCISPTSGCKSNRFFANKAADPPTDSVAQTSEPASSPGSFQYSLGDEAPASEAAAQNVASADQRPSNSTADNQFDLPPTLAGGPQAADAGAAEPGVTPASAASTPDQQLRTESSGIAAVPTQLASAARKTLDVFRLGGERTPEDLASEIASFREFPFAFNLPTVGGEQNDSRQFTGQLIVVDIWATWCGPCKKAIPEFIELQNEFESHGVQVVGITCDSDDPAAAAETTRKAYNIGQKLGVNYPLLVDDGTTKGQIPGFRSYPTTLFLTADGQVQYMVVGVQPKERMAQIIRTILQI